MSMITCFVMVATISRGETYYVWKGSSVTGPGTAWANAFHTIQRAVDAAANGDTIFVRNGVYDVGGAVAAGSSLTNRVLLNKSVTVTAVDAQHQTIILGASDNGLSGNAAVRGVYLITGAVLEGFTISNGHTRGSGTGADDDGGGIYFDHGGEVRNCAVTGNMAADNGGGIRFHYGGLADRCVISGNRAEDNGGGVYFYQGGELRNSLVVENTATNEAGGIRFNNGGLVRSCTVSQNDAGGDGGGIAVYGSGTNRNTLVYFNSGSPNNNFTGGTYRYCCLPVDPGGTGNITNAPEFVTNSYWIAGDSPCRNAGYPGSARGDYDLPGNSRLLNGLLDIGAYQTQFSLATDSGLGDESPGYYSTMEWGDFDKDDDLDFFITHERGPDSYDRLYVNNHGVFTMSPLPFPETIQCDGAWGDYDRDGDLDFLIGGRVNGWHEPNYQDTRILLNNGGTFSSISPPGLPALRSPKLDWGDYDNDGDLDVLIAGFDENNSRYVARIYRCVGAASFTDIGANLSGNTFQYAAWIDVNADGELDAVISSFYGVFVYLQDAGTFKKANFGLPNALSVDWGDYDNDGDLDCLLVDWSRKMKLFTNHEGTEFVETETGLPDDITGKNLRWADVDNDGHLDFFFNGGGASKENGYLVKNDGNGQFFVSQVWNIQDTSTARWGDYDNDDDLDLLMSDFNSLRIYKNETETTNTLPTAPGYLQAEVGPGLVRFSWNSATDLETPADALSYNIRIGSNSMTEDNKAGMANLSNGYRRVPAIGNVNGVTNWNLHGVSDGQTFYWSVQAVDGAYAGGAWATEQVYTIPIYWNIYASSGSHGNIAPSQAVWVVDGTSTNFVMIPDPYWHVKEVWTNGTSLGAQSEVTW